MQRRRLVGRIDRGTVLVHGTLPYSYEDVHGELTHTVAVSESSWAERRMLVRWGHTMAHKRGLHCLTRV
jgi:hypothetical protein